MVTQTNYGTRITNDDRDGHQLTVQLTAPAGTRQTVMLPERTIELNNRNGVRYVKLAAVEQILWPHC